MFSIIDALGGRVYDFPFTVTWTDEIDYGVNCRRDSKAVHIVGYLNESGSSADRWYVWDGTRLSQVSEKPSKHADDKNPIVELPAQPR
jgi:hypothetical protein